MLALNAHANPKAARLSTSNWLRVVVVVVPLVVLAMLCQANSPGNGTRLAAVPDLPRNFQAHPRDPTPTFQPQTQQVWADVVRILEAGPRVAGSDSHGHTFTRGFIAKRLLALGLDVEIDTFDAPTALGHRTFHNVVGTWHAAGSTETTVESSLPVLVLAAHYDSKLCDFHFVGASDAAASCAMLLDLAQKLAHGTRHPEVQVRATQVKFVFFDGEEAFVEWTSTDSLYGARHLAGKWAADGTTARIELFVLLDLIGCRDCQFVSWFPDTHIYHMQLANVEKDLRLKGIVKRKEPYFRRARRRDGVEDDHLPFLQHGVPVLHLIAHPFPSVWHSPMDTLAALNLTVIRDVLHVLHHFLGAFLTAPNATAMPPTG